MLLIREYVDERGRSPFAQWFENLDAKAAAKVTVALARIRTGDLPNVRDVGRGVLECRIDWGPGYRMYFGRDGETLVILLAGRTGQEREFAAAERWDDYRRGKTVAAAMRWYRRQKSAET